jgi:hypothetical protein
VPQFGSVLKPGDQVFPVAVPPDAPPGLPAEPSDRLAYLAEHSVDGYASAPAGACEGFVRISAQHWLRLPVSPPIRGGVYRLAAPVGSASTLRLGGGDPLGAGELTAAGPGAQVEVFCHP